MKTPLISVLIPIYNKEKYLKSCLDSVLNQTYKNLEVILINDGSTDKSKEICEKYKEIDNRVRLINQENKGISEARNKAIELSTGDFFVNVNADDLIANDYCETLLNAIIKTDADLATCAFKVIPETAKIQNKSIKDYEIIVYDKTTFLKNIYLKHMSGNRYGSDVTTIYRKNLHGNVKYPKNLYSAMDGYYYMSIWEKSNKFAVVKAEKYFWRTNSTSQSKNIDEKNLESFLKYSEFLYDLSIKYSDDLSNLILCERIIASYIPIRYIIISNNNDAEKYDSYRKLNKTLIHNINKKHKKTLPNMIKRDIFIIKHTNGFIRRLLLRINSKINSIKNKISK